MKKRNPIAKAVKKIRPKVVPDTKCKKLEAARAKETFQYNEPVMNEPIKSVISYSQIDEYCLKDLGKHISEEQPKT